MTDEPVQARRPATVQDLQAAGIDLAEHPGLALADLEHYPVLSEGGWFLVIKDRRTLQTLSRQPWRLLGPIHLLSETLDLD